MAKTREKNFLKMLSLFTTSIDNQKYEKPTLKEIADSNLYDKCVKIYRLLGGILDEIPIRVGGYDFIVDGKIIELDEEAHFNRYRKITLQSKVY
ncbi:MAG: hypothetical protein IIA48_10680, partial [Bacteroidetes bacterium]|nr:hypothetical protein [Bacteroidota bacterium]